MQKVALEDRELVGWLMWGQGTLPSNGWILVKRRGEFPKAYLAAHIPSDLDTTGLYWQAGPQAQF